MTVAIRKVTKRWTAADGKKVRICDMSDTHLINAIEFCQRAHRVSQLETPYPSFGGEMAQFYAEHEWTSFQESGPEASFDLYEDLCEDAIRRGLEVPCYSGS